MAYRSGMRERGAVEEEEKKQEEDNNKQPHELLSLPSENGPSH